MEESPSHRAVSPDNATGSPSPQYLAEAKAQDESSSSSSESDNNDEPVQVGGEIPMPAFCLLDGVVYGKHLDPSDCTKITVPLTRIPATLGRSHDTTDESFFGLGPKKAISREQCRIYFQEPNGGRFVYKEGKFVHEAHNKGKKREVISLHEGEPLPSQGFFCIECLGKNKITVGKNRVEQGQVAQLESGTPIRMSTVCVFFLLPTDAEEETMEIPAPKAKRKRAPKKDGEPTAKRQATGGGPQAGVMKELEAMSPEDLLKEVREKIDSGVWERRQQLSSGILAFHAVKDASRSKKLRKEAREKGAISRQHIMDWIADSSKYGFWVKFQLSRVELSSYQGTVTKALLKAGYAREGATVGRYVKWILPPSAEDESEISDEEAESDGGGEESDGALEKASDDDVKMSAEGEKEEEQEDSSDVEEEDEVHVDESAMESGDKRNDDEDGSSSSDSELLSKPAGGEKEELVASEGGGSDSDEGDEDDGGSDSSNEEKALASAKADGGMDDVAGGETKDGSSSAGSDGGEDEVMANAAEAKSD